MKTIVEHETGIRFESDNRITKCPFGKNRKMKDFDSIYNEVCDGCKDNWGGFQNSEQVFNRCYYENARKLKSLTYADLQELN